MINIHVLTIDNNPNSFSFVFPLFINRNALRERGLKVKIFYSIKEGLYDGDVVFIDNKFFKHWWKNPIDIYNFLKDAKRRTGTVLWFDTSDSTGTPQFEVLPYVDGYYKNQILKDVKLYFNNYYRSRIFSDYYHKKFNISDTVETGRESPLDSQYLDKIHVSWNPGLNDHGLYGNSYSLQGNVASRLRRYSFYNLKYSARFSRVRNKRHVDLAARLGFSHPRNFVIFHREMLKNHLKTFNVDTSFINHISYYKELKDTRISISPFGLGEITYRDFETIICGALLLKPDMDHVDTWPNIYKENETYVKCNWDFSDLHDKVGDLLANPKKLQNIAMEAQRNYRYYLFGAGRYDFCDRINEIVERHKQSKKRIKA